MRRKNEKIFAREGFQVPGSWRCPGVLTASLGINLLGLALPIVILQVYDRIIPNQAYDTFLLLIVGLVLVVVLDTALKVFRSMILSWEGARFDHRESLKAMNRLLDSETLAFERKPAGYYLDKMHALEQIQEFFSGQSVLLLMDLPFVVIYMGLIWMIAGPLVLVPVVLLLLFVIASVWTGRHLHEALETRSIMEDRRQNFIIETLQGIHTVKSMAMEALMLRRYEKLQAQSAASVYELSRVNSVVQGIGATFSQMAVVTFVAIGSAAVIDGSMTIGALAAGTMLSSRVLQPGLKAMGFWTQFQSVRLAKDKVSELFSLQQEHHGEHRAGRDIEGALELENLSFSYPEQGKTLIRNLSLRVEPGEAVGITGNNGSGKSTLIKLISGFLQPDQGRITLDGRDINEYQMEYLRAQIGIVPQKGILFEGTILENMTLYREGEAVAQALELSSLLGLDEFLSRLPEGLDTMVGGAAVDFLSEGIRQKIIMIRALVGHPQIVLLDDANASFDIKNDNRFLKLVQRMKGHRTLIIVSHRPSLLRLCDRRLFLRDGCLEPEEIPVSQPLATAHARPSVQGEPT